MSELRKLSMSELIAKHNELANELGIDQATEFKNLAAARDAVAKLQAKLAGSIMGEGTVPTGEVVEKAVKAKTPGDQKYNSSGQRGPNQGVGAFAKELITAGGDNKTVLEAVLQRFPEAKTTTACIAYYRTKLKAGPVVADPAALRAKAEALMAEAAAAEAAAAQPADVVVEAAPV